MKPFYSLTPSKSNQKETLSFNLREEEKTLNSYFFTYSYQYDWIDSKENDIVECSFNQYDYLRLSNKKLYFTYNHKNNHIYLKNLTRLELTFRRLMLPILTGGIVAPLSLLAVFLHILAPFLGFSIFLVGLMMLYYGYRGTYQLVFHTHHQITISLFVDDYTDAIGKFVKQANEFIHNQRNKKWDLDEKEKEKIEDSSLELERKELEKTEIQEENNEIKTENQDNENQSVDKIE